MTKGAWEVKRIAGVAPDRVYYTSDEGNSLETHLYSVKLDGGDKRRLDKTPGTHNISMGPGGSYYLDTHSSLTEPPSTTLHSGDGAELGVYRPADRRQMDEYEMLPTEIVTFKTPDGIELSRPPDQASRIRSRPRNTRPSSASTADPASAFRSTIRGRAWSTSIRFTRSTAMWSGNRKIAAGWAAATPLKLPIFRQLGVVELADQVAGVKYLISLGFVDPARVGIHGWSYGGFMTLKCGLERPRTCSNAASPARR